MKPFEYDYLKFWFQPKNRLFRMFEKYRLGKKKKYRRLFFDNGGKVLLVAHIDTVQDPKIHRISRKTIHAQGLDDRLGCAIGHWIMEYLPVDLLICDYEESGRSTAQYHDVSGYNFIIELDRGGTDFVDYDGLAENNMIEDIKMSSGMKCGYGSFSDICFMNTNKIGAVNWGIGYQMAHARNSCAPKKDIQKQVRRLWEFIDTFQDRVYKEEDTCYKYNTYLHRGDWLNYSPTDTEWYRAQCEICGNMFDKMDLADGVCIDCTYNYLDKPDDTSNEVVGYDSKEYETYTVMLDGETHPVKMKKIKIT